MKHEKARQTKLSDHCIQSWSRSETNEDIIFDVPVKGLRALLSWPFSIHWSACQTSEMNTDKPTKFYTSICCMILKKAGHLPCCLPRHIGVATGLSMYLIMTSFSFAVVFRQEFQQLSMRAAAKSSTSMLPLTSKSSLRLCQRRQ